MGLQRSRPGLTQGRRQGRPHPGQEAGPGSPKAGAAWWSEDGARGGGAGCPQLAVILPRPSKPGRECPLPSLILGPSLDPTSCAPRRELFLWGSGASSQVPGSRGWQLLPW